MRYDSDVLYVGFVFGHGGDAQQMLELATGVAARGARVRIVVPDLPTTETFAELCAARGLAVVRSPWISIDPVQSRQSLMGMLRLFSTFRAPIVHVHTGDVCLPRLAMLALSLLRMPRVFVTVQSPYDTLDPAGPRARSWAGAVRRRVHWVVAPSQHGRATQIRYGVPEDQVVTIYNGIDVGRFGAGDEAAARAALGVGLDVPLVVFTSRLDRQKRPIEAVEAFGRVAREFPDALLVFLGTGKREEVVREAIQQRDLGERVRLVGHQTNVPDWLAAATVWILPTESENFSLAVLEAMAAGCPILSTFCPGNDEVLRNGENAIVVPVGDVDGLTEGLRRLLADGDLRARLSATARADAQNYSLDAYVQRNVELYRQVADAEWMATMSAPQPVAARPTHPDVVGRSNTGQSIVL